MKGHDDVSRARPGSERGFSLMEAIVATVIATIAVLGLAYSFGNARGLVNRFETSRVALAAAQRRMEGLAVLRATDPLLTGTHTEDVAAGATVVHVSWTATPYSDPVGPGLKQIAVSVTWDGASTDETIRLTRLFPL